MRASFLKALAAAAALAAPLPAIAEPVPAGAYLAARQAQYQSDFLSAARFYTRALAHDPGNRQLMEAATVAYLALGQVDRAAPVARRLTGGDGATKVANMALIAHYGAAENYERVLDLVGEGRGVGILVDGLVQGWAEVGRGDIDAAVAAFDAMGEERGLMGFALYHKALALASAGDFAGAEAIYSSEVAGAMQMTRRGVIARIEVLSQLGRNDDAIALLEESFGADLDPELRGLRARLAAGETLPFHLRGARDGLAEVFYTIAGALRGEANDDFTLLYTRVAGHLRPGHVDAVLMAAELLEDLGQYELATEAYKSVPRDHPSHQAAEIGRAQALRQAGKPDAAIEVLEQLSGRYGDYPAVHSALGDMLRALERYDAAAEAYDRAIALYDGAPSDAAWFLYYARGIAHERLDEWPAAEADFRQALELNPDQPQVLNYLGYSLVEKQEKLEEALEMIERAVEARPDSGYIVDSLGWALYRLGRYEEAVGHMERAAELLPVDPIVNDHLGDVYWAVGRRTEARFQWNRALSFDPEQEEAERIRRKLEVGLDAVLAEEGAEPLAVAGDDAR
ncbi:tetratricopeptide repeat protein [Rhodosalinus sediminis]|uniref:Tetratricopeptide repeat protein n=1 Tax=Rhodosalinus sediminis TaxID=1940533 RepID=A0A3D9BWY8_9RHOB|nr:tetratricopeptide repeat protein [Rhodosalinus sediminis]REC57999.1 tetratricopeptide repeat protein [Rhodosalinus sediminis]